MTKSLQTNLCSEPLSLEALLALQTFQIEAVQLCTKVLVAEVRHGKCRWDCLTARPPPTGCRGQGLAAPRMPSRNRYQEQSSHLSASAKFGLSSSCSQALEAPSGPSCPEHSEALCKVTEGLDIALKPPLLVDSGTSEAKAGAVAERRKAASWKKRASPQKRKPPRAPNCSKSLESLPPLFQACDWKKSMMCSTRPNNSDSGGLVLHPAQALSVAAKSHLSLPALEGRTL